MATDPLFAETSILWGKNGERWNPKNRLPDYSYVGYKTTGFKEIPRPVVWWTISDNGDYDITSELKAAINAVPPDAKSHYVIFIPAGTWKVSNLIKIEKNYVVIRGAGKSKTRINVTRSTGPVNGGLNVMDSYEGPFFFSFNGRGSMEIRSHTLLTYVTKRANKYETNTITVANTSNLSAGDRIILSHVDKDGSEPVKNDAVWTELFNGNPKSFKKGSYRIRNGAPWHFAQIKSVRGNQLTLTTPVPWNIDPSRWRVNLYKVKSNNFLKEVGIEELHIDFPKGVVPHHHHNKGLKWNGRTYKNHEEVKYRGKSYLQFRDGFEAVGLINVVDSWVRNIRITDSEFGVRITGLNSTGVGIELGSEGTPIGSHYGVSTGNYSHNILFHDILLDNVRATHHVACGSGHGSVFSKITKLGAGGIDLDLHKEASDVLFTEVVSDGNAARLPGTSISRKLKKNLTWWNITTTGGDKWKPEFGPSMERGGAVNLIGVRTSVFGSDTSDPTATRRKMWIEETAVNDIQPSNLYLSQFKRRFLLPPPSLVLSSPLNLHILAK